MSGALPPFGSNRLLGALSGLPSVRSRADWNDRFAHWERPASVTEEGTIERAQSNVQFAIAGNAWLLSQGATVEPQGSYHNRTNVRTEADIDLRVQLTAIKIDYAPGVVVDYAWQTQGYTPAVMSSEDLIRRAKEELVAQLRSEFGHDNVTPGSKAIKIREITGSRAEVDVVPAVNYHFISWDQVAGFLRLEGIALSTGTSWIHNFPIQHYERGVEKRSRTGHRYKRVVRIFKRLRTDMEHLGAVAGVPSFLVESLVFNVDDNHFLFENDDRYDRVRRIATQLQWMLRSEADASVLVEANGIKRLFGSDKGWTYSQAKAFIDAAVAHLG